MLKLLGYTLLTLGLAGLIFSTSYTGTKIPLTALWFVLSFFIAISGIYFIIKHKWQEQQQQSVSNSRLQQINQLRHTGEKIKITLDNSEVRTRSYQQEIGSDNFPTRIEMLDGLYDGNRNYRTKEIQQTYIVFYKQYEDQTYKFISQPTTLSDDAMKRYIDNQRGVDLYIDKTNPNNYYFDLAFI